MTLFRNRFLFGVPLIAGSLLLAIAWWSDRSVRRTISATLQTALQSGLDANVTALEIWINTQTRIASVIANDPEFQKEVSHLVTQPTGPLRDATGRRGPGSPEAQALQHLLDQRILPSGFGAAMVIGTNLQIVATSSRIRMRLGDDVEPDHAARVLEVFTNERPVLVTPFKVGFGRGRGPGGRGRFAPNRPPLAIGEPSQPSVGPPATDRIPGDGPNSDRGQPSPRRDGPPEQVGGVNGPERRPPPPRGDFNLMEILAPVRNPAGEVIAAIAFVLRPDEEFTKVLSVARPGDTGETFAFDAEGRLISESRFNEQLVRMGLLTNTPGTGSSLNIELRDPGADLTQDGRPAAQAPGKIRPLSPMVARAIQGESGVTTTPERDYRGVPVVGAWKWLPDRNFGVAMKVDAAEAFRPLFILRRLFSFLLALLLAGTLTALASSYGNLVWRRRFNEARLKALRLGQYTLSERIGEGGMGVVYRANHALLRRDTAIKLLLPERADETLIRQFEREVQLTCRLTHPNTIQIFDYGRTDSGVFYYAMELLEGMTLHELVERHGPQPEERVIHFLVQICGSLGEAHAAGLIHRDIKPGNLFLCERGGQPDTIKVLDFGLVRRYTDGGRDGHPMRVEGTPLYMAPETVDHPGAGDPRSDLYALGAVAYLLITGRPVFEGTSMDELFDHHRTSLPTNPRQWVQDSCSEEFESLILCCLNKDPAQRPSSAAELTTELLKCQHSGKWTPERRQQWWQRWIRKENRTVSGSIASGEKTVKIGFADRMG